MSDAHLDHPGEVTWFVGHGPARMTGGLCLHSCDHDWTLSTIAWGPDHDHYSLVACRECGCRAWTTEYPPPFSPDRPKFRLCALLEVAS